MTTLRKKTGIGALIALGIACGTAVAVDDCCSNTTTEISLRNELFKGLVCSSVWNSQHREVGKFCLPLGAGYACGAQTTLTVGQEFTLSGSFMIGGDIGGVTVGASTTYSVQQAFTHTAGNCQSCQLFASYGGAVLRQWMVQRFYPFVGDSQEKVTIFTTFGLAPTVTPCCEVNNNCAGCPEGGGGDASDPRPIFLLPIDPETAHGNRGVGSMNTMIVDLREPSGFFPAIGLPPWHPMHTPGSSLATLNGWQKHKIMREVREFEMIQGGPLAELVVIDLDGEPTAWDLDENPGGIVPCPADMNVDSILDLADIGRWVDYFVLGDPTADLTGNGVLDLSDVGAFVDTFLSGCVAP
jgi:hypothetical protein